MKILKLFLSLFAFVVLSACEDLSFSDEDSQLPKAKGESRIGTGSLAPANQQTVDETIIVETTDNTPEEKVIPEEEITTIAEDFELTEDTVIKNTKVVLEMATIKTNEHDLVIVADEFFSNHSVIQNFPLEQKAAEQTSGRNGGNILVEAKTASGTLQVALSGESAGVVPAKRSISREERRKLSGRSGRDGRDAIYREICTEVPLSRFMEFSMMGIGGFPVMRRVMGAVEECKEVCAVPPTRGQASSSGRQGLPGSNGLNGGDSGSFHLKALHLSDFQLTKIQNTPGLGSKGGKGSAGGYPGEPGRNGRDSEELCGSRYDFPRLARRGEKGNRGPKGADGKNGEKGEVCLESLVHIQNAGLSGNAQNKGNVICY
ncbi:MAG: hypothetical protein OXM55_07460 [Bdellovibrionales bacterium]|nr:hypothetical protein [Bdellovibrionales bacterium]